MHNELRATKSRTNGSLMCCGLAYSALVMLILMLAPAHAQNTQSIVVLVNDDPITNFDVQQRSRFYEVTQRQEVTSQIRERIVDDLIEERLKMQEARENGIAVSQDEVAEILNNMAQSNEMTAEQLEQALSQVGVHVNTLRDQIRANLAWRDVVRRRFQRQVNIAASQVDEAMAGGQGSGSGRERIEFQLYRVHLEVSQNADQATIGARLSEAEQLRGRFASCQNVEAQVQRLSRATVRDVGRRNADDVPQPTRALLMTGKEGEMTPPVITASGIELYAICGMRKVQADTEQRREIQAQLADEEFQRLARGHLSDLRASAYIERPGETN